jgi:hypothetical protein
MNGTPPIVQTEHIDEHMARVYISFTTVPAQYVDCSQLLVGAPHPMVAIATVGKRSPIRLTRERIAVENCLQQLQNNVGCFVPDYEEALQGSSRCGNIHLYIKEYSLLINLFLVHIYFELS